VTRIGALAYRAGGVVLLVLVSALFWGERLDRADSEIAR
jgi:hypothetical protein